MELLQEVYLSNLFYWSSVYYLWKNKIKRISYKIASILEYKSKNKILFNSLFLKSFDSLDNKKILINHTFYNSLAFDYVNYKHKINIINKFLLTQYILKNPDKHVILINNYLVLKLNDFKFKNIYNYFLKYPKYAKIINSRKYDILEKYLSHLLIYFNPLFIFHFSISILMDIIHYSLQFLFLIIHQIKNHYFI